jgi:orotate phosphoribosyltransferase
VTWVPGHDGSPGPGYAFAELVADARRLPLVDAVQRTAPIPSAHRSTRRATLDEQVASLHARATSRRLVVVDNTATSGTSLHAVIDRLHAEGVIVTAAVTASISRHLTATPRPTPRGDPT